MAKGIFQIHKDWYMLTICQQVAGYSNALLKMHLSQSEKEELIKDLIENAYSCPKKIAQSYSIDISMLEEGYNSYILPYNGCISSPSNSLFASSSSLGSQKIEDFNKFFSIYFAWHKVMEQEILSIRKSLEAEGQRLADHEEAFLKIQDSCIRYTLDEQIAGYDKALGKSHSSQEASNIPELIKNFEDSYPKLISALQAHGKHVHSLEPAHDLYEECLLSASGNQQLEDFCNENYWKEILLPLSEEILELSI